MNSQVRNRTIRHIIYFSLPVFTDVGLLSDSFPEVKEARSNRRNWRFSLSFRGFLLYLFNESQAKRHDIRRIRAVISNPLTQNEAPFLKYWQDFEKCGFDVIDLLLKISIELRNQLHIEAENDNYLLRRVTERYFVELTNFFENWFESAMFSFNMIKKLGIEKYLEISKKLKEYRLFMLKLQSDFLKGQLKIIGDLQRMYSTKS